jgi:cation:H+ antiporter
LAAWQRILGEKGLPMSFLPALTLPMSLAVFTLCAGVVWISGARLTYLADVLSDRLNLAKSLTGLLVLSVATSLPEIATTLSAAVKQNAELVLNNLFGGIGLQTAILATADIWARGAITNYPRKANHALEATLLVLLLAMVLIIVQLGEPVSVFGIGLGSVIIAVSYVAAIWLLRRYDGASDWVPVDLPDLDETVLLSTKPITTYSNRMLILQIGGVCLVILVFGVILVETAEQIARDSGLGSGLIGVTLLAGATSLPELTTTLTAVRMGAYTLAISNIFGSNLIMLVLVFPADVLITTGPIMATSSPTVGLSLSFGIAVTAIYLVGLIVRRKPKIGPIGLDSFLVFVVFLFSLVSYYFVR